MELYKQIRYFALALDPIHIGTGGYRIGRVDNTIVREPATGIPKIPGTTIEGVCRNYAYLKAKEDGENLKPECAKGKTKNEKEPCGNCRICITFGYTAKNKSLQAMVLFSDARILFFPVATMIGPVWVTCPMVLKDVGIKEINNGSEKDIQKPSGDNFIIPENSIIKPPENKLNFGWLLLKQDNGEKKTNIDDWVYKEDNTPKLLKACGIPEEILKRIVIVPDTLFPQIVNSNLEVRTSVAIDPERGAAEEGALFTYEAIPRGTVFWFDITYQNPRSFPMVDENPNTVVKSIPVVEKTVEDGLKFFEFLGIGGMSSRGFGRLKVVGKFVTEEDYIESLIDRLNEIKDRERELKPVDDPKDKSELERLKRECEVIIRYLKHLEKLYSGKIEEIKSYVDRIRGGVQ